MTGKAPLTLTKDTAVPASVTAKIKQGVPKRTALSSGKKPTSSVKV